MPWLTDPSITNQVQPPPNPLAAYAQFAQLKSLGQEQQYNQARLDHLATEDARSKALLPSDVASAETTIKERLSKLTTEHLDQVAKTNGMAAQYLSAVDNAPPEMKPQVYQQVHAQAVQDGIIPQGVAPDQWGQQADMFVKQKLAQAVTVQQHIENELNNRKQVATERNMIDQRDLEARGQDMTAATAKRGQDITQKHNWAEEGIAKLREGREANNAAKPKTELAILPDGTAVEIKAGMKVPDGTTPASQLGKDKSTKVTGANSTALRYAIRGLQASDDIMPLEEKIAGLGLMGQARLNMAPNVLQSDDGKLYTQAARGFTEARLRKDSGAAIPEHEFENDRKMYFAQPGDTKQVLTQKRRARAAVLEGIAAESGPAYEQYFGEKFQPGSLKAKYGGADAGGGIQVKAPNGQTYTFPDQAAADKFKKAANIQ